MKVRKIYIVWLCMVALMCLLTLTLHVQANEIYTTSGDEYVCMATATTELLFPWL